MTKFVVTIITETEAHKFEFPDLENTLGFIADYENAGSDLEFLDVLRGPADSFEQVLVVKEEAE